MYLPADVLALACATRPVLRPSLRVCGRRTGANETCLACLGRGHTLPVAAAGVRRVPAGLRTGVAR